VIAGRVPRPWKTAGAFPSISTAKWCATSATALSPQRPRFSSPALIPGLREPIPAIALRMYPRASLESASSRAMYPILLEWFRKKPVLREVARADVAETAGAPPSPPHVPAATPPAPISTPAATDEDDIDWAAIFARIPKGSKLPRIRRAPKPPDVVKSKKYVEVRARSPAISATFPALTRADHSGLQALRRVERRA
jgi:hypothetical protein